MNDYLSLLPFLALCFAAALTGGFFMPGSWYETLRKPSWTPPNWLFAPAWTILYVMIAVAGWLVWEERGFSLAIIVWGVQLAFNAAWSWLMFGKRRIDLALIDAGLMWVSIAAFIALAWPISETAAWLFVPYLVWVSYATALNLAILRLNPHEARVAA